MHTTPQAEGSAAPSKSAAGLALNLAIGQRVRHVDSRVTGTLRGLAIEDNALSATIRLDAPIVIPARGEGDREIHIYTQHLPAHELAPFDARDELIAEMLSALQGVVRVADRATAEFDAARLVIAKAQGGGA